MTPPSAAKPCPVCARQATPETAPFCSRRCANVDLHRWFSGRYAIPAAAPPVGDAETDED